LLGVPGFLGLRRRSALVDLDGRKPTLGDAQRACSFLLVRAPDRQSAAGGDFFDQSFAQELADHFVGGTALQVGRKFNATILALRGRGQKHKLVSVSFIGISVRLATASRAVTTEAPLGRESRRGRIPGASMALYEPQQ